MRELCGDECKFRLNGHNEDVENISNWYYDIQLNQMYDNNVMYANSSNINEPYRFVVQHMVNRDEASVYNYTNYDCLYTATILNVSNEHLMQPIHSMDDAHSVVNLCNGMVSFVFPFITHIIYNCTARKCLFIMRLKLD
jgi:hypothetical protein